MTDREPLVVKLGPRIFPPRPPRSIWSIEVQQPSTLHSIMMPLRGVQTMLRTNSADSRELETLLRNNFQRIEAKVTEIATGDWKRRLRNNVHLLGQPETARRNGQEKQNDRRSTHQQDQTDRR
jgi:hypothetical protein